MSKSTPDAGTPDAVGLGAAQAAQKAVAPDTVILFGSRARGDHRPDSDVDLLVIHDRHTNAVIAAGRANRAVKAYFKATRTNRHRRRYHRERTVQLRLPGPQPRGRASPQRRHCDER